MRAAANEYRAKAFECLSLAECMTDPERRAEILRYARWWMQLTEPVGTSRSAYEGACDCSLISCGPTQHVAAKFSSLNIALRKSEMCDLGRLCVPKT